MTGKELMQMLYPSQDCMVSVLDVGAIDLKVADAPYSQMVQNNYARVVGFEPDVAGCEALNKKYGSPHLFLPHFIYDGKPATFYETNWALTGSLFKPNQPLLEKFNNLHELMTFKAEHPVETKRLDDIPEVGDIDFVKIDVQGAELSIFENGERVLRNAVVVQTEVAFVEMYENQPLFAEVDQLMRSYGYQFHTFLGFAGRCFKPMVVNNDVNQRNRQILWSDAVYVKDWLNFGRLSLDKLKKLALVLHEFKSFDLSLLVLKEIDTRGATNLANRYFASITAMPPTKL